MNRSFQGIWIPKEIWLNANLSIQAKCLWAEIQSLHCKDRGGCYASDSYLMEFMGIRSSRLQEIIKELKDANLVEKVSFDGRQRVLKALTPPEETGEQLPTIPGSTHPENRVADIREAGEPSLYIGTSKDTKKKKIAQSAVAASPSADVFFSHESGKFEGITQQDLSDWKTAYPDIDVGKELVKATQWLKSNPSKANKRLWRKFVTGWLGRCNDKAENQKAYRSQTTGQVDRRTKNIDGTPVASPVDGMF